ncbi:capsule assembly Wzi family protein [candidate division KSB1 bacterium]|nr:capsule assembly Wzi family protein [candidate division KSB1 bacterium]
MTSEVRIVKIKRLALYGAALFLSVSCEDQMAIAQGANISIHGFGQGNYTSNLSSSNPDNGDFKWAGERFQLKLEASLAAFRSFAKVDAFYDHIDNEAELELREGYVDYSSGSWDLRVGRQIITWGLGDLIFINDVFPKDYEAFFSGRPLEYLKKGIDGVKIAIYPDFTSFELIAIPFFEPNTFPQQSRFWMFDPLRSITNREEKEPTTNLSNTEFAARSYRGVAGFDVSLYFYKGFFRQPSITPDHPTMPTKLILFYPKLSVYGASLQGSGLGGVLSLEAGQYDSRQDRDGTDPLLPNSQTRFLIGYQRQLWQDFTVGLQYYSEYMHDYSAYEKNLPSGFPKEDRLHQLAVIRLTQFLVHQTVRVSFFSFYSPSEGDYQLNPEMKHNFSDHIWTALGANVFGGDESWSRFGQLDKNDNIYLQFRYEF